MFTLVASLLGLATTATAAPLWPGGPDIPGFGEPAGPPPRPTPNFDAPKLNPANGEVVGIAQPVIITFPAPVTDRAAAEAAIEVTSSANVPGHFYWMTNSQLRWRPEQFWPANTSVTVDTGNAQSTFTIGDAVISTADDNTKIITVTRNGAVVKTMPTSMGKTGHETPNGTYILGERYREMYMDSSTYGVPVNSAEGYRVYVEYATRMSYNGIFVHAAPWSVAQQGNTNASHGCLNVSTDNARWFYENTKKGDPVIVTNTAGGRLSNTDGLGDWN